MSGLPYGFRWEMKPELSEADRKQIFGWAPDIFGVGNLPFQWRLKDLHFISYDGSYAASHVGTVSQTVDAGGEAVQVCGIGGVTTRPEYQGKRLAHALLAEALSFGREKEGATFGFLFCLPKLVPFYRQQGWQQLNSPIIAQQPEGEVEIPFHAMTLPLREKAWPSGTVRVQSLPW